MSDRNYAVFNPPEISASFICSTLIKGKRETVVCGLYTVSRLVLKQERWLTRCFVDNAVAECELFFHNMEGAIILSNVFDFLAFHQFLYRARTFLAFLWIIHSVS